MNFLFFIALLVSFIYVTASPLNNYRIRRQARHHDEGIVAGKVVKTSDPEGQAILEKFQTLPKLENLIQKDGLF